MKRKASKARSPGNPNKKIKTNKDSSENNTLLNNKTYPPREGINGVQDSILNKLSRLFEKSSQGCTAITFINNKILITDNAIHAGSTESREGDLGKITVIKTAMNYFADVAEGSCSQQEMLNAFEKICLSRVQGEGKGYVQLNPSIISTISKHVLLIYKPKREKKSQELSEERGTKLMAEVITSAIKKTMEEHDFKFDDLPHVFVACNVIALLARDFIEIEKFLQNDTYKDNQLKLAFSAGVIKGKGKKELNCIITKETLPLNAYKLMSRDNKKTGYVILKIDDNAIHAEVKLLEYLFLTGILQNHKDAIYIAISKHCCYHCSLTLKAFEKVIKESNSDLKILYAGIHGLNCNAKTPFILNSEIDLTAILKGIKKPFRTIDKISKMLKKVQAHYIKLEELYGPNSKKDSDGGVKMVDRSITILSDDEGSFEKSGFATKKYQETHLSIAVAMLLSSKKYKGFIGIADKETIQSKLTAANLLNNSSIIGIYIDADGNLVPFYIEMNLDKSVNIKYADHSYSACIKDFILSAKTTFNVNQISLESSGKVAGIDGEHEILALQSLAHFSASEKDKDDTDTAEEIWNQSKDWLDTILRSWNDANNTLLADLKKLIHASQGDDEKNTNLLSYIRNNKEEFKSISITQDGEENTLFDILIQTNFQNNISLKPYALSLIELMISPNNLDNELEFNYNSDDLDPIFRHNTSDNIDAGLDDLDLGGPNEGLRQVIKIISTNQNEVTATMSSALMQALTSHAEELGFEIAFLKSHDEDINISSGIDEKAKYSSSKRYS
jgi:hypothetical protein